MAFLCSNYYLNTNDFLYAGKYFDRVSERLRDDEEFMEELLFEEDPSLFKYASLRIRSIRSFAMEAVQMEGSNMEFLPDAFKDDEEIALAALDYIDGIAWYHLSNRLKQDQDFIDKALIKCYHVLKFLPVDVSNRCQHHKTLHSRKWFAVLPFVRGIKKRNRVYRKYD